MTRIVAGATYASLMKVLSLALNTLAYWVLFSDSEVLPPNRTAVCEKAAMPNLSSVSCQRGMHACGQSHAEVVVCWAANYGPCSWRIPYLMKGITQGVCDHTVFEMMRLVDEECGEVFVWHDKMRSMHGGLCVWKRVRSLGYWEHKDKTLWELFYPEQNQARACAGATHLDSAPCRLCVEVLRNHAGQDSEEEARKCAGDNEKIRGHKANKRILCKRWKLISVEEASRRRERRCATEHLADKRMCVRCHASAAARHNPIN